MKNIIPNKKGNLNSKIALVFFIFVLIGISGIISFKYLNETENSITGYSAFESQEALLSPPRSCDTKDDPEGALDIFEISTSSGPGGLCGAACTSGLSYRSEYCDELSYSPDREFCYKPRNAEYSVCVECVADSHCGSGGKCNSQKKCETENQASCGNGIKETGEGCDDHNTVSGDGCSSSCQVEIQNGCDLETQEPCISKNPVEICVDENHDGKGDICKGEDDGVTCKDIACGSFDPQGNLCSDGYCPPRKSCERQNGTLQCVSDNPNPTQPTCSDKIKNQGEREIDCGGPCQACQDFGDSNKCQKELKGTCQDETSPCSGSYKGGVCPGPSYWKCCVPGNGGGNCGNGNIDSGEECDDHNTVSGDGCSSSCKNEGGSGEKWHENIIATYFHGGSRSAGDCGKSCAALPTRRALGKSVEICKGDICIITKVGDVGPWCEKDNEYVEGDARPYAEIHKGKVLYFIRGNPSCPSLLISNGAGIDITPDLASRLGMNGKGKVKWRFV